MDLRLVPLLAIGALSSSCLLPEVTPRAHASCMEPAIWYFELDSEQSPEIVLSDRTLSSSPAVLVYLRDDGTPREVHAQVWPEQLLVVECGEEPDQ